MIIGLLRIEEFSFGAQRKPCIRAYCLRSAQMPPSRNTSFECRRRLNTVIRGLDHRSLISPPEL
jgi:hypothetical protein